MLNLSWHTFKNNAMIKQKAISKVFVAFINDDISLCQNKCQNIDDSVYSKIP